MKIIVFVIVSIVQVVVVIVIAVVVVDVIVAIIDEVLGLHQMVVFIMDVVATALLMFECSHRQVS